jgi:hypothetical protein
MELEWVFTYVVHSVVEHCIGLNSLSEETITDTSVMLYNVFVRCVWAFLVNKSVLANMYELGISSDRGWMFCNTHVCTVFYKNFDRLVDHWKRKKCINGFRTQSLPLASVKLGKTYSWNVKAIIAFATKTTGWTECIERMARKLNSLFVI